MSKRVRIEKCNSPETNFWYKDYIGDIFEVFSHYESDMSWVIDSNNDAFDGCTILKSDCTELQTVEVEGELKTFYNGDITFAGRDMINVLEPFNGKKVKITIEEC